MTNELVQENSDCFKVISKAINLPGFLTEENFHSLREKGLKPLPSLLVEGTTLSVISQRKTSGSV